MEAGTWVWLGLAAASAASLAVGRPWTLLAARGKYPPEVRALPAYVDSHRLVTAGWTAYFGLAALVTQAGPAWVWIPLVAITPCLGKASHAIGPRYAQRRLTRTAA